MLIIVDSGYLKNDIADGIGLTDCFLVSGRWKERWPGVSSLDVDENLSSGLERWKRTVVRLNVQL